MRVILATFQHPTGPSMENAIKFLPLCFFSQKLQINDYPASLPTLKNALLLHFLLGLLIVNQLIEAIEGGILMLAEMFLTLGFVWFSVLLSRHSASFLRVASAFFVCANIIGIISFPFAFWLNIVENERVHLPFYIAAVLMLWYLAVVGFLLRRFLHFKLGNCFSLTLLYFLICYVGAFGILFM
ncbi:MAG: hypothetical protein ACU837_04230 [Gammaproteobacteria bacterium]